MADTFMGSGSTVAAAEAAGVNCVGVERYADYYQLSRAAIPALAALKVFAAVKDPPEYDVEDGEDPAEDL